PDIIRMNREAKQSLPQKGSAINDRLPRRFASRKDKLCHNIYCVSISSPLWRGERTPLSWARSPALPANGTPSTPAFILR
ncbi:MAG: hypothetical protein Q8O43_07140, partial [Dehalococcoidia bacterium]|nr:hypothetical protein [Dehalococcoidia bacterium]